MLKFGLSVRINKSVMYVNFGDSRSRDRETAEKKTLKTAIFVLQIYSGFIRSGKIRGKHIFFEMVRESQGESGKVREFNEKVREKLEKVREIFLESSYLL